MGILFLEKVVSRGLLVLSTSKKTVGKAGVTSVSLDPAVSQHVEKALMYF